MSIEPRRRDARECATSSAERQQREELRELGARRRRESRDRAIDAPDGLVDGGHGVAENRRIVK